MPVLHRIKALTERRQHRTDNSAPKPSASQARLNPIRTADILPAQMYVGIGQPENLDRIWVIPGCRDQSVKAWSGPVKSRTTRNAAWLKSSRGVRLVVGLRLGWAFGFLGIVESPGYLGNTRFSRSSSLS